MSTTTTASPPFGPDAGGQTNDTIPAVDWMRRVDEARPFPWSALIRVESDGDRLDWGSGVLVDPHHVLTCFHVVHPPMPERQDEPRLHRGEPLPHWNDGVRRRRISVELGDGTDRFDDVAIVGEDDLADLALLRLDRPILGPGAPIEPIDPPSGLLEAAICGFGFAERPRFEVSRLKIDPHETTRSGGRNLNGTHDHGVEPGKSGGPIFASRNGEPIFLGLAELGGLGVSTGAYVAADTVRRFLAGNRIDIPEVEVDDAVTRWCRVEGYRPVLASPRPDLVADHCCLPFPAHHGVRWFARHPVAVGSREPASSAAARLVAHLGDARAVHDLLDRLRRDTGLPLRLPTRAEFAALCRGGAPGRRIAGRPATIDDHLSTAANLTAPPDTSAEWVEEKGRLHLVLHRDGEIRPFDDPAAVAREISHVRCVVRTVLEPGSRRP